jgi:hypothetical protein
MSDQNAQGGHGNGIAAGGGWARAHGGVRARQPRRLAV